MKERIEMEGHEFPKNRSQDAPGSRSRAFLYRADRIEGALFELVVFDSPGEWTILTSCSRESLLLEAESRGLHPEEIPFEPDLVHLANTGRKVPSPSWPETGEKT